MTLPLARIARLALLLVAGFVLGMIAISAATAASGKNAFLQKMGLSSAPATGALADNSCTVPGKDSSKDVYFVSCGGFF